MQPSMLGIPAGAEDDEVPCALTATAVMAKTTNSLENMVGWVFFRGEWTICMWFVKESVEQVGRYLCGSYIVYEIQWCEKRLPQRTEIRSRSTSKDQKRCREQHF
jgi:hypothetical protein